jgi:hypothetical protein
VLEILLKWSSDLREEELTRRRLSLQLLEHGFPYGLTPFRYRYGTRAVMRRQTGRIPEPRHNLKITGICHLYRFCQLQAVLRIRDVYPRIPDPNFSHPGFASKNLSILTPKRFLSSRKLVPFVHLGLTRPGSGSATLVSGIRHISCAGGGGLGVRAFEKLSRLQKALIGSRLEKPYSRIEKGERLTGVRF